VEDKKSS